METPIVSSGNGGENGPAKWQIFHVELDENKPPLVVDWLKLQNPNNTLPVDSFDHSSNFIFQRINPCVSSTESCNNEESEKMRIKRMNRDDEEYKRIERMRDNVQGSKITETDNNDIAKRPGPEYYARLLNNFDNIFNKRKEVEYSEEERKTAEEESEEVVVDFELLESAFRDLQEAVQNLSPRPQFLQDLAINDFEEKEDGDEEEEHKVADEKQKFSTRKGWNALPEQIKELVKKVVKIGIGSNAKKQIRKGYVLRLRCIIGHVLNYRTLKRHVKSLQNSIAKELEYVEQEPGFDIQVIKRKLSEMDTLREKSDYLKEELSRVINYRNRDSESNNSSQEDTRKRKRWSWGNKIEDLLCVLRDEYENMPLKPVLWNDLLKELLCLWPLHANLDLRCLKRAIERSKRRGI